MTVAARAMAEARSLGSRGVPPFAVGPLYMGEPYAIRVQRQRSVQQEWTLSAQIYRFSDPVFLGTLM